MKNINVLFQAPLLPLFVTPSCKNDKDGGHYYSAFQSATIVGNHIENLTLIPTTIDDFKLQLGTLP